MARLISTETFSHFSRLLRKNVFARYGICCSEGFEEKGVARCKILFHERPCCWVLFWSSGGRAAGMISLETTGADGGVLSG